MECHYCGSHRCWGKGPCMPRAPCRVVTGGYLGSDLESPSVFHVGFLDTRPQEDSDAFTEHFLWPAPWPRPQASSLLSSQHL